jgi:carboxylate-amine ligase
MSRSEALLDPANLYWDMRLSPRHPTVEIRVCDVTVTVQEAALLAVLVQGLTALAYDRAGDREATVWVPQEVLRADLWRAVRDGARRPLRRPDQPHPTARAGSADPPA